MKRNLLRIIILFILVLLVKEIYTIIYTNNQNKEEIITFYNNKYTNNKMMLEIPKINLQQIVYKADYNFKNLNNGLVYYKNNDINKKIVILGHSGMGPGVYFNKLDELSINDNVYLYIKDNKITYEVTQKYIVNESNIDILKIADKPILILITCDRNNKRNRLIVKLNKKSAQSLRK